MFGSQYQSIPSATATVANDSDSEKHESVYQFKDGSATQGVSKGEIQPPAFRDPFFAVLFLAQLMTVFVLSVMYAIGTIDVDFSDSAVSTGAGRRLSTTTTSAAGRFLKKSSGDERGASMTPVLVGSLSGLLVAPLLSIWMFGYMRQNAIQLIQLSIYMAIGVNVLLMVLCLISGAIWPAFLAGLGAFFTGMYARYVWHQIPLAAANLKTAIASIQSQIGVAFLGFASVPFYVIWLVVWIYCFTCSLNTRFMKSQVRSTKMVHSSGSMGDDDYAATLDAQYSGIWWFLVFLLLLSFYWTNQVVKNTIQATVAGTVGTFWFVPDEAVGCCCSPALSNSLFRSLTYSFGSICMGSLIVAVIQALRAIVQQAEQNTRNNNEGCGALLLCLTECLLGMLQSLAEYFNKWAFIYVGLYGYPYLEAGHNVLTLFRERGWTAMISDNLTARVLGMMSFAIGLGTGLVAAVLAAIVGALSGAGGDDDTLGTGAQVGISLVVALLLGMVLASAVSTVVNSAADTVIVLFAEAPAELQQNHPGLAMEMNQAWAKAYPDWFHPSGPTLVV